MRCDRPGVAGMSSNNGALRLISPSNTSFHRPRSSSSLDARLHQDDRPTPRASGSCRSPGQPPTTSAGSSIGAERDCRQDPARARSSRSCKTSQTASIDCGATDHRARPPPSFRYEARSARQPQSWRAATSGFLRRSPSWLHHARVVTRTQTPRTSPPPPRPGPACRRLMPRKADQGAA